MQGQTNVYQILSDYQDYPNGGNGYLRIMRFDTALNQVEVSTFSPYLNQYKSGGASNFNLSYSLNATEPFTIIVLPDTQYYSRDHPDIFLNQTKWIVSNRIALNVVFVIHLGDIVDNPYSSDQWYSSKAALGLLSTYGVPYSVLPGNHDFFAADNTFQSYYYLLYGPENFVSQQGYGGSEKGDNYNNFSLLDVGLNHFLVLSLQSEPAQSTLNWANMVIQQHSSCSVILVTHEFLSTSGRTDVGNRIWDTVVKPNVAVCRLVLCGHNNGQAIDFNSILHIASVNGESLRIDRV